MLPLGLVRVSHPRGRRRRAAARGAVPPPPILRQAAAFHRTARREVWPLIGVAVIVGAVAVRYVMRAHRRVQLEEQGQNPGRSRSACMRADPCRLAARRLKQ
jgi:hypothetical protein